MTPTVLVIEDDPNKLVQITSFLRAERPKWIVEERHSYQSGLKAALLHRPTVLLLDMTMPTYDDAGQESGGRERRYAGEQILMYLQRKKLVSAAVIVTQFERFGDDSEQVTLVELSQRLQKSFPQLYKGTVFYQAAGSAWRSELSALLTQIERELGDVG
jgi:DNA-binding NarL/FixJ family response regulator